MVGLAVEWMRQPTGEIYNMDTETVFRYTCGPLSRYSYSILGLFWYLLVFVCRKAVCLTWVPDSFMIERHAAYSH